jgi:hypothetical protein
MRKSREYETWARMRARCLNPTSRDFMNYGGRGIAIVWQSFEEFYHDMGPRPGKGYSIERLDNNGPYSKQNCIWATSSIQNRNKRNNILWTYNGITQCIAAWAEMTGIQSTTLYSRYHISEWSLERTLTTPVKNTTQ